MSELNKKKYYESQKFNYTWAWLILLVTSLLTAGGIGFGMNKKILQGEEYGTIPLGDIALILLFSGLIVFHLAFLVFLIFSRLTFTIDAIGIEFRFFPFQQTYQKLTWDMIYQYNLREYSAESEYGGYGVRYGRKGYAYTVKGKFGLQIVLKNGKEILLGTQQAAKLNLFLESMRKELSSTTYFIQSVLEKKI
ncbi:MAG: hypothetical protein H7A24_09595 [Leptospiraceae bacterium]|nr:hypothetical protein [Leptospiraceae bacterium]MCP5512124.1 hypothetical protein [Leptospiraceae bacterium]